MKSPTPHISLISDSTSVVLSEAKREITWEGNRREEGERQRQLEIEKQTDRETESVCVCE